MQFDIDHFWKFCEHLRIATKEKGEIRLSREHLLGTQRYFIEQVVEGIKAGKHEFWVLKCRQASVSTICLALDLYMSYMMPGMSGALVTHNEESREMFRGVLKMMMDSLPVRMRYPALVHNRNQLILKNRSRFSYLVAGKRKNTSLGKGNAMIFAHCTEVSEYGDPEGMASLQATFAQDNPNRLFIYESTAQGYNHFYDAWNDAKEAVSAKAIFIGWWLHEGYRKEKGSPEYEAYWDGKLTAEERQWTTEVKREYGVEITDEQIAWWRWTVQEKMGGDVLIAQQNYPHTDKYAFVKPGSSFFDSVLIDKTYRAALKHPCEYFRFDVKFSFDDVRMVRATDRTASFWLWERPVAGGNYVIGADPAYGSSEWADRFCISVWRCYADQLVQVAEFNTADCLPVYFAWIVTYIAGMYTEPSATRCMLNLELNGPGQAVWTELKTMRRLAMNTRTGRSVANLMGNIRHYKYRRVDTFGGPTAYHTQMDAKLKERMFNAINDNWVLGRLTIRSPDLVDEMRGIEREDGDIGAPGRGKDDRVVAAGLAIVAWYDFVRVPLQAIGLTYEVAQTPEVTAPVHPLSDTVSKLLAQIEARG